jgi:hypothetical protein
MTKGPRLSRPSGAPDDRGQDGERPHLDLKSTSLTHNFRAGPTVWLRIATRRPRRVRLEAIRVR